MPGNSNYLYSPTTPDYTAIAIEQLIKEKWTQTTLAALPIAACIRDRELHFNKGFTVTRADMIIPIAYEEWASMTESTLGIPAAQRTPSGWPVYDQPTGFTQAKYPIAYLRRPLVITKDDRVLLRHGERGDIVTGKIKTFMSKWARVVAQMQSGTAAASDSRVQGTQHVLSVSNTVGGIPQSSNTWWRAEVRSGVATLLQSTVEGDYDVLGAKAQEDGLEQASPDLLLADNTSGGFNVYGKIRQFITDRERYMFKDFKVKFGVNAMALMGMKVVMNNLGAGGTYQMLNTETWYWAGPDSPSQSEVIRIPGSDDHEYLYDMYCQLGCGSPRHNLVRTGVSA